MAKRLKVKYKVAHNICFYLTCWCRLVCSRLVISGIRCFICGLISGVRCFICGLISGIRCFICSLIRSKGSSVQLICKTMRNSKFKTWFSIQKTSANSIEPISPFSIILDLSACCQCWMSACCQCWMSACCQ